MTIQILSKPQNAVRYARVLAQGRLAEFLPPGWEASADLRFDAIVVDARTETGAISAALGEGLNPIAPVIAPAIDRHPWAEAWGDQAFLFADQIVDRARRVTGTLQGAGDPELLLARIVTRGGGLQPTYSTAAPAGVIYAGAGPALDVSFAGQALVDQGLARTVFFDRFGTCPACGSAHVAAREECSACRSANLYEEALIHHFKCAHQDGAKSFIDGAGLRCPKCHETLRHIGLDYDKPGSVMRCLACNHADDEASVGFRCFSCAAHHDTSAIAAKDVFSYFVTVSGMCKVSGQALVGDNAASASHFSLAAAFKALVHDATRQLRHFDTPFTILALRFSLRRQAASGDPRIVTQAMELAHDAVRSSIRDVDTVLPHGDRFFILLPRRTAKEADNVAAHILATIGATIAVATGAEITHVDPRAIDDLIAV